VTRTVVRRLFSRGPVEHLSNLLAGVVGTGYATRGGRARGARSAEKSLDPSRERLPRPKVREPRTEFCEVRLSLDCEEEAQRATTYCGGCQRSMCDMCLWCH
jgi:hypothetical protein